MIDRNLFRNKYNAVIKRKLRICENLAKNLP